MLARARLWSSSARMESWYTWYGPTTGASPSRSATTTATRTGALTACRRSRWGCFSAGTVHGTPQFAGNTGLQPYRFGAIVVFGSRGGCRFTTVPRHLFAVRTSVITSDDRCMTWGAMPSESPWEGAELLVILSYPTITSWSVGPREKLIVPQLVCRLPAFHATRTFTTARHVLLSWIRFIQPTSSSLLQIHFNIIHPYTPWHSKWAGLPGNSLYTLLSSPLCATPPPSFDHSYNVGWWVQIMNSVIMQSPPHPRPQPPAILFLPMMWEARFHIRTKRQTKWQFRTLKMGRQKSLDRTVAGIVRI